MNLALFDPFDAFDISKILILFSNLSSVSRVSLTYWVVLEFELCNLGYYCFAGLAKQFPTQIWNFYRNILLNHQTPKLV